MLVDLISNSDAVEVNRSNIYALLSSVLLAPANQQLIDVMNKCDIESESWQSLKKHFSQIDLEQLDDEYHRLFIGVGTGELLPYCSHYLTGCLMGKPLSNLKEDLQILGLEKQDEQKDPEDHIASIFEVMRISTQELELSFEQQKAFYEKYILSWADTFFTDLIAVKDIKHYQLVAYFGQWFLQREKEYFSFN